MPTGRDVLPFVLIRPATIAQWQAKARDIGRHLVAAGISPDTIPDERAEDRLDGTLLLYIDLPWGRESMVIPPGEWRWSESVN